MRAQSRRYVVHLVLLDDIHLCIGSRVNDEILRLVPNTDVYRDSLRCIKLWAQRGLF